MLALRHWVLDAKRKSFNINKTPKEQVASWELYGSASIFWEFDFPNWIFISDVDKPTFSKQTL